MGYFRSFASEASDEAQDAGFVDTVANLDDVAAFVDRPVIFVHLHLRNGNCSKGRGNRNEQTEKEE